MFDSFTVNVLFFLALTFVCVLGLGLLTLVVLYLIDINQHTHTIRRNYPVLGRFRYLIEHLGTFLRPYLYAQDREELPFNRAERQWVYRACKNVDSNIGFGSTRDMDEVGSIMFLNSAYPTLEEEALTSSPVTIGPNCRLPYTTDSLFNISAMSYGSISKPAVRALSYGAAKAGCWLNTGEGGLSPYHLEGGCDIVFQIGTAKYGVRDNDGLLDDERLKIIANYPQVKMFEIKLSQGAKPGKGGILPAEKVTEEIAAIRNIPAGFSSNSPNRHIDIKSAQDLLDMVNRVRNITGKPVGFKAVIGEDSWLLDLFALVRRQGLASAPDFITIDSADGGTGAAPQPLMDYVGLLIKESLPWVVNHLIEQGLRERIKVVVSGKLITPSKVAWALAMGADFVTSARGFMFSLGCIQARQCHKNTCPTGVTTHNPKLQRGLNVLSKTERVAQYQRNIVHSVGLIAHSCGVSEPRQLQRKHMRMVIENGLSQRLDELFPQPPAINNEEHLVKLQN
jgi:glutamate synthase domain-containing protein 2